MISAALWLILLSAACRTTRPEPSQPAPDPRILAGRWNLELGESYLLPFGPALLGGRRDPFMVGELRLDSVVVPVDRNGSAIQGIEGIFIRALSDGDEPPPLKYPATAAFLPDGQVIVTLTFPTTCPCPVHELVGPLNGSEIRGRSSLAMPDHTLRGRFILRRHAGSKPRTPVPPNLTHAQRGYAAHASQGTGAHSRASTSCRLRFFHDAFHRTKA